MVLVFWLWVGWVFLFGCDCFWLVWGVTVWFVACLVLSWAWFVGCYVLGFFSFVFAFVFVVFIGVWTLGLGSV